MILLIIFIENKLFKINIIFVFFEIFKISKKLKSRKIEKSKNRIILISSTK